MLNDVAFGIVAAILFISLLVLFCVLLVKLYIHKIKTYTRVIYEKDLDFQKTLNTTIIETQEQVLNNISQDLHDDAGQQLTYINFMVENLKLDQPELTESLEPISNSVQMLSRSIRSISHSLNNQLLMQQDLVKAIESEVQRLQKNTKINFSFTKDIKAQKAFGTNEKIVIYRIFQEVINNIFKHSGATEVNITLSANPRFKFVISDNGKGFDVAAAKSKNSGIGLNNVISRAEIIKFDVEVQSVKDKGTTITLAEAKTL